MPFATTMYGSSRMQMVSVERLVGPNFRRQARLLSHGREPKRPMTCDKSHDDFRRRKQRHHGYPERYMGAHECQRTDRHSAVDSAFTDGESPCTERSICLHL